MWAPVSFGAATERDSARKTKRLNATAVATSNSGASRGACALIQARVSLESRALIRALPHSPLRAGERHSLGGRLGLQRGVEVYRGLDLFIALGGLALPAQQQSEVEVG